MQQNWVIKITPLPLTDDFQGPFQFCDSRIPAGGIQLILVMLGWRLATWAVEWEGVGWMRPEEGHSQHTPAHTVPFLPSLPSATGPARVLAWEQVPEEGRTALSVVVGQASSGHVWAGPGL